MGAPASESTAPRGLPAALPLLLVAAAALGAFLLRGGPRLTQPQFWAEDGATFYADAHDFGLVSPLVHPYSGYFQTLSRLVADVSVALPLHEAPRVMVLVAVVVQVYTAVFLCRRRFWTRFGSRPAAYVLAAAYVLVPNSAEEFANLTNSQWHLAFLALAVLVSAAPVNRVDRGADWVIVLMCALTGPFVVVLVPFATLAWLRDGRRRHQLILLGILVGGLLLQVGSILAADRTQSLGGVTWDQMPLLYVKQVVIGGLLGQSAAGAHVTLVPELLVLAAAALLLATVVAAAPLAVRLLLGFGLLMFVASMVGQDRFPYGRGAAGDFFMRSGVGQRYYLLPILALYAALAWGAFRSPRVPLRALSVVALLVVVVVAVPRDFRYKPLVQFDLRALEARLDRAQPGQTVSQYVNGGLTMTLGRR